MPSNTFLRFDMDGTAGDAIVLVRLNGEQIRIAKKKKVERKVLLGRRKDNLNRIVG